MGVAPAEPGEHSTIPPRVVGGNMDVRYLTTGSTLLLPIAVEQALFSVGDVHAAQGDGEVCGTGIECHATVTLRFDLRRDRRLAQPEFHTPRRIIPGPCYGTAGVSPDLMEATRQAVWQMIAYLKTEHGFRATDAYILCSAAVDLAISEVVDGPNWIVSALLPLQVLTT
jgi:acetamidase/formamidase